MKRKNHYENKYNIYNMNKFLKIIYTLIVLISLIIYICNFKYTKTNENKPQIIKYFIMCIASVMGIYSLYKTNKYINKYILPLLIFLNVASLLYVSLYENELNTIHIISLIGLVYLLLTFNYKDFELLNGILLYPNKSWIYKYIFILGLWFISSSGRGWVIPNYPIINKTISCLILVYPLLFPIKEFFIHRTAALVLIYMILNIFK